MSTRTRMKSTPGLPGGSWPYFVHHPEADEPDISMVTIPAEPPRLSQIMRDTPKRWIQLYNDCTNLRRQAQIKGYTAEGNSQDTPPYCTWVSNRNGYLYTRHEKPIMSMWGSLSGAFPELRYLGVDHNLIRAFCPELEGDSVGQWKEIRMTLSTGFSLVNFLLEYDQIAALMASWLTKRALANRWHSIAGKGIYRKDRIRSVANEYLAHEYGTRLFIQDMRTIFETLVGWKDRADRYLRDTGTIRRSYKTPLEFDVTGIGGNRNIPVFETPYSYGNIEYRVIASSRAQVGYSYHAGELKGFIARLAQLSDSFGVRLDAGIVWDAIPFSFIVDWFVNISEWLHRNYSRDWFRMDVVLEGACKSAHLRVLRDLHWYTDRGDSVPELATVYSDDTVYYQRRRCKIPRVGPTTLKFMPDGLYKRNRAINAGALATQNALATSSKGEAMGVAWNGDVIRVFSRHGNDNLDHKWHEYRRKAVK